MQTTLQTQIIQTHSYNKKEEIEHNTIEIDEDDEEINLPFSENELNHAIDKLKDKKCPGPDSITSELIKQFPRTTKIYLLLDIYNYIWQNKVYPQKWREVITYPIPKPNKNKTDPNNYRPISASNVLSKVLQMMVNQRLVWHLENKKNSV